MPIRSIISNNRINILKASIYNSFAQLRLAPRLGTNSRPTRSVTDHFSATFSREHHRWHKRSPSLFKAFCFRFLHSLSFSIYPLLFFNQPLSLFLSPSTAGDGFSVPTQLPCSKPLFRNSFVNLRFLRYYLFFSLTLSLCMSVHQFGCVFCSFSQVRWMNNLLSTRSSERGLLPKQLEPMHCCGQFAALLARDQISYKRIIGNNCCTLPKEQAKA